jgi:hypothetical protein
MIRADAGFYQKAETGTGYHEDDEFPYRHSSPCLLSPPAFLSYLAPSALTGGR